MHNMFYQIFGLSLFTDRVARYGICVAKLRVDAPVFVARYGPADLRYTRLNKRRMILRKQAIDISRHEESHLKY